MVDVDKVSILIADDRPEKLLVYQSILEELNEKLVTAQSGEQALKQVLQNDFAVILLDVHMPPGMDGFETAKLIRQRQKSAHTPIIFITALLDDMRPREGYAHGAVDYIMAPFEPDILRAKVKVFIDLFRLRQQGERRAEERIILAEEKAKRLAAEEANRRYAFLARASALLANSLDLETTLRQLAELPVPFLADQSAVCLVDEQGLPGPTELASIDDSVETGGEALSLPAYLAAAVKRVLETGARELIEGPAQPADGKIKPDCAVVFPLIAREKTLGCLALAFGPSGRQYEADNLSLAEDLSCRAAIAIDNALLVRNIQDGDRRKDEFLAMLAHELRNPLAPIRNAVEILRMTGPAAPPLQTARDLIDRQLRHLTRLVDDLLDVSRITQGKIKLQMEVLDLTTAAVSAVEASRPLIDSRKHEFLLSLPAEPLLVKADPARLAQVLSNLLNNAAKYTEEGGKIWLTAERESDEAIVRVRDTGSGISSDILPRVFDPFIQGEQSADRSQGGLGIGLTLVRRLVEMHGGSVEANSRGSGLGSEFVVRLPLVLGQSSPARTEGKVQPSVSGAASRIIVVDDNVDSAESLAMVLRLQGHEVRIAHEGPAALAISLEFLPTAILLDIGLPGMDGHEVARNLRNQAGGDRILIAAVTGYGRDEDRSRSQQAGFDHHLVKPIDLEALEKLLASAAHSSMHRQGTAC
jgi:signal transduction histidine kinase/DNA-binding response OmpR family regulator